jgi:hypothetical protein
MTTYSHKTRSSFKEQLYEPSPSYGIMTFFFAGGGGGKGMPTP